MRRDTESVFPAVTRHGLRLDPTHPPLQFLLAVAKIHFDRGEPEHTVAELAIAHRFEAPSAATLES